VVSIEDAILCNQIYLIGRLLKVEGIEFLKKDFDYFTTKIEQYPTKREHKDYALARYYASKGLIEYLEQNEIQAGYYLLRCRLISKNYNQSKDLLEFKAINGVFEIFTSALPDSYKWIASQVALAGNAERGKYLINLVANSGSFFAEEAALILDWCKVYVLHEKIPKSKIQKLVNTENTSNLFSAITYIGICKKLNYGDVGLQLCQNLSKQNAIPTLFYYWGCFKTYAGDWQGAKRAFSQYLRQNKIETYKSDTYYKLALISAIEHNPSISKMYLDSIKLLNYRKVEVDKYAYRMSHKPIESSPELIKSRFYFDGGYFSKADSVLSLYKDYDPALAEEYLYRVSRTKQMLNDTAQAIKYYKKLLELPTHESYYAPLACLYTAQLLIDKDEKEAEYYLKKCLTFNGYEYQSDTESKAQKLLKQIKNKTK
jgi:hypothetical protein